MNRPERPQEQSSRAAPITLIILAWNAWSLTRRTLDTLLDTDIEGVDVLVVDNGSTDETPIELQRYAGSVRILRLPENVGYVRGNNAGIALAPPGSDIVLLNSDLIFEQKDWLTRLHRCAHADERTGVVGCRLTDEDGLLVHTGTFILPDTLHGQQSDTAPQEDVGQFIRRRKVQGIVFAVAYLRRTVVEAIGGLDPAFKTYFEDTDYCLRAIEAGFDVVFCGDVTIAHVGHGSTRGMSKTRERLFRDGQAVFGARWKEKLEAAYACDVLWQSVMNILGGYGNTCRSLLLALDQAGVRAAYKYVYGPGSPVPFDEPPSSDIYRLDVMRSRRIEAPKRSVTYALGNAFHRAEGKIRIGYTMIEVDGFPAEWVRQANALDEVWVPSGFNRDGFVASGLKRPIRVMPLGFDADYFHPAIQAHRNPRGEFVFLSSFEWGERKEPALLLKTFNDVFRANEDVRLVVKINNRDPAVDVASEIRKLRLKDTGGRISYVMNRVFPYYQLGSLYRSADCFISAGRGEGWDMPLMEAMACGVPAIATDWGAHREFVHDRVAYPLAITRTVEAVARCPYYEGHKWAEPDRQHFAQLLRHVYENREEAQRIGAAGAAEMHARWTWADAAERVKARLLELS